jgi:hypothetical protein
VAFPGSSQVPDPRGLMMLSQSVTVQEAPEGDYQLPPEPDRDAP